MHYKVLSIKYIPFVIFFITLTTYFLIHTTENAYAEAVNLGVAPAILQIEALPPADVRAPFVVENLGDEPVDLKIGYKLFKASDKADGHLEYLGEDDTFPGANPKIFDEIEVVDEDNFSVDSLNLGPKQKANLILRVVTPKNEPFSDYYFSLIFISQPQKDTSKKDSNDITPILTTQNKKGEKDTSSISKAGIAINVLLSIGPKDSIKGYIEEFSTPWYKDSGPVSFAIKIKNNGSSYITPQGVITITNMFGQKIGQIELEKSNILAGSARFLTDTKNEQSTKAIWRENFLLGLYTAKLTIGMSDKGPIYEQSLQFLALPVKLLAGLMIAIIIIILAYLRIKNKLSSE